MSAALNKLGKAEELEKFLGDNQRFFIEDINFEIFFKLRTCLLYSVYFYNILKVLWYFFLLPIGQMSPN